MFSLAPHNLSNCRIKYWDDPLYTWPWVTLKFNVATECGFSLPRKTFFITFANCYVGASEWILAEEEGMMGVLQEEAWGEEMLAAILCTIHQSYCSKRMKKSKQENKRRVKGVMIIITIIIKHLTETKHLLPVHTKKNKDKKANRYNWSP